MYPDRIFFNVGNGLFTMEIIDDVITVYDCGAQNVRMAKNVVYKCNILFSINIDILFLSHYDKDHVNGIYELLTQCSVKHVVLPHISPVSKFISYVHNRNNQLADFYIDTEEFILRNSPNTTITYVEPNVDINENIRENIEENAVQVGSTRTLSTGVLKLANLPDWYYVLYNRYVLNTIEEHNFLSALGLSSTASCMEIINVWKQRKLNMKKFLCQHTNIKINKLNDYSMTLWTGNLNDRNSCLYTGDYNANQYYNDLSRAYKSLLLNIRVVQVPHHGSVYNFNSNLIIQGAIHVISAKRPPYISRQHVNPTKVIAKIRKQGECVKCTMYRCVIV